MKKLLLLLATVGLVFTACENGAESGDDINPYQLGDFVERNGVKGVVFYLGVNGETKIVSVEESEPLMWGEKIVIYEKKQGDVVIEIEIPVKTGAYDWYNGADNMAAIRSISNWTTLPEAFDWCSNYGEDWYLPSASELKEIWYQKDIVNKTLSQHGYPTIGDNMYWSSTENNGSAAVACNMGSGNIVYIEKKEANSVRAVYEF